MVWGDSVVEEDGWGENNKIRLVPSYWRYKIIEGKKVIIDQLGNVIAIVVKD